MTVATLTMNPAVDVSTDVDHVAANRKLRCRQPSYEPGGGGINIAAVMKRLGAGATAVFPCGGPHGDMLQRLLDDEGIRHVAVPIEGWTRANLAVSAESSDDQYRFVMPGPTLSRRDLDACLDALADLSPAPDIIAASGSFPPGVPADFIGELADRARAGNARLVVDTSGDALRSAAVHGVYLLKPNMRELRELTGGSVDTETEQEQALKELVQQGACEVAVLSLGAAGVLLTTEHSQERLRAPAVPIASRVGAGDSMVAGILVGLTRGDSVRDSVLFGVAAGSAAVMTPGTELCRPDDVRRLYRRMQNES